MYLDYFQMQDTPFRLTPDTQFYYQYRGHKEALEVLTVAINMGEGFIKVTGEVGTGKTLLCHQLMNSLGDDYFVAHLANPFLSHQSLQMAIADAFGIDIDESTPAHKRIKAIKERLIELNDSGKQVILLIDEAQSIPEDSLESLRLLTNFETEKTKLVQIVLFGQPELEIRLNHPAIRQLKQRITFSYHLQPMDKTGVEGYVQHRLQISGYQGDPVFSHRALNLVFSATRGTPRLVNILCHKALMLAYGAGVKTIQPCHIRSAAKDSDIKTTPDWQRQQYVYPFLMGLASTAFSASALFWLSANI